MIFIYLQILFQKWNMPQVWCLPNFLQKQHVKTGCTIQFLFRHVCKKLKISFSALIMYSRTYWRPLMTKNQSIKWWALVWALRPEAEWAPRRRSQPNTSSKQREKFQKWWRSCPNSLVSLSWTSKNSSTTVNNRNHSVTIWVVSSHFSNACNERRRPLLQNSSNNRLFLQLIILKLTEPGEKRCYRNRNTSFSVEICWSNVLKYPYFPSKKLRRS